MLKRSSYKAWILTLRGIEQDVTVFFGKDIPVGYLMLIPICITVERNKVMVSKYIPVKQALFHHSCNML